MKQIETLPNLTEQAYQVILQEICDGSLPPGTHLVQEYLAAQLGVSRQPIQQAMTLLKADGMVEEVGRRGLRVAELDLNLMQHHYDIRAALDGRAARGAALRCADDAFADALREKGEAIIAEGRVAVGDEAIGDMIRHDEEFHYLIYEASGNPLLAAHRDVPALMPYLHLPVQSGSDRVLAAMNRQHSAADYIETVAALRAARPDLALSSDFIVGHPGESDDDFQATLRLVRDVGYAQAYSFKYSPRPGTPAASAPSQLADEVKDRRLGQLQALLADQQRTFNSGFEGRVVPVLFDRQGRNAHQLAGRSPHMQAVHVTCSGPTEAERLFGEILPVRIREIHANSLAGALAGDAPEGVDGAAAGSEPAFV